VVDDAMDLHVLQHEPMQVVDDVMDLQVLQHGPMQVVDQPMEEVHIVEVVTTPKKSVVRKKLTKKKYVMA
jgi:hypothetical protein